MSYSKENIGRLVEEARVHRSVYTDPAIFDLMMWISLKGKEHMDALRAEKDEKKKN